MGSRQCWQIVRDSTWVRDEQNEDRRYSHQTEPFERYIQPNTILIVVPQIALCELFQGTDEYERSISSWRIKS